MTEVFQRIFVVGLCQGHRFAYHARTRIAGVQNDLVRCFGQPAAHKVHAVDIRQQRMEVQHVVLPFCRFDQSVDGERPFRQCDGGIARKRINVLIRKPQRGDQAEIVQQKIRQIIICRFEHGIVGNTETDEESDAQRDDGENRQKSAQRGPDGAEKRTQKHGYHSMSSTGVTVSLTRCSRMVPLLTLIMRSAMAVSAELCVMMTTVMPVWRAVSCSSLRMALPVT